jgi:hypothetical protein
MTRRRSIAATRRTTVTMTRRSIAATRRTTVTMTRRSTGAMVTVERVGYCRAAAAGAWLLFRIPWRRDGRDF